MKDLTGMDDFKNWKTLHCGRIKKREIELYVKDEEWQKVRLRMKNTSLTYRWIQLFVWLVQKESSRASQVQVTNYINALKRGGMVK
jgi:hypothetical protein